jgi:uncharacterized protein
MAAEALPLRTRIATFVATIQAILFLAHLFIYETWVSLTGMPTGRSLVAFRLVLAFLSISFVAASLLAHRYFNGPVRGFYRFASVWLGTLNFLFIASCACWIAYPVALHAHVADGGGIIAETFYGLAILASLYGVVNAANIRIRRVTVKLPGLPASWHGRVAALVTDTHLGHIKGYSFIARLVGMLRQLKADVVFISGDMFDGTKVDAHRLVSPWKQLSPRFGSYFVTGNHEEFSDPSKYLQAVRDSGIRVLHNEKVNLDGLQVVGVPYGQAANAQRFESILENSGLDRERASVLLTHVPHALPMVEKQGISLQLSGHTHGGQMFPFTWFTWRIFGEYTYGLKKFGELFVYTSSGAGTWGPPMRVCTQPEIVLIAFE